MKQTNLTLAEKLEALTLYEISAVDAFMAAEDADVFAGKIERMAVKMREHGIRPDDLIAYQKKRAIAQLKHLKHETT